jgi:hypothetical protein
LFVYKAVTNITYVHMHSQFRLSGTAANLFSRLMFV